MAKTWYPLLDVFRVLATFAVMMEHFRNTLFPVYSNLQAKGFFTNVFYFSTRLGHSAVIILFVLSGFLVGGGVCRSMKNRTFMLPDYAVNRIVRIFLPLWGAIALFSCLSWIGVPVLVREVSLNALCLQGFLVSPLLCPYWTMPIELLFYILIGAVACVRLCYGWCRYLSGAVMVLSLVLFYKIGIAYLIVFLLGSLISFQTPRDSSAWRFLLSLCLFFGTILLAQRIPYKVGDILLGLGFAMLVRESIGFSFSIKYGGAWVLKMFSFVSRFSYSIYLIHMIVMVVLTNFLFTVSKDCPKANIRYFNLHGPGIIECFSDLTIRTFSLYFVAVTCTVIISWCFYEVVEKRTKRVASFIKKIIGVK